TAGQERREQGGTQGELAGGQVLAEVLRLEAAQLRERVDRHVLQALGAVGVQAELVVAGVQDEGSRSEPERKSVQGEGHRVLLVVGYLGPGANLPTSAARLRTEAPRHRRRTPELRLRVEPLRCTTSPAAASTAAHTAADRTAGEAGSGRGRRRRHPAGGGEGGE